MKDPGTLRRLLATSARYLELDLACADPVPHPCGRVGANAAPARRAGTGAACALAGHHAVPRLERSWCQRELREDGRIAG